MTERSIDTRVPSLRPVVLQALRLLALGAAVFLIDSMASSTRLVALLGGVLAMEFGAGPLAIRWDEPGTRLAASAKKALLGFAVGAGVSLLVALAAVALGAATIKVGQVSFASMGLALVVALAQATRDEMLFRGLPLKWLDGIMGDEFALPFVALLGAAPLLSFPNVTTQGLAIAVVTGLLFAFLWRLGTGMYLAWGAHAGWLFMLASGLRGSLLDVRFVRGSLVPSELADGLVGWLAVGVAVIAAAVAGWVWWKSDGETKDEDDEEDEGEEDEGEEDDEEEE